MYRLSELLEASSSLAVRYGALVTPVFGTARHTPCQRSYFSTGSVVSVLAQKGKTERCLESFICSEPGFGDEAQFVSRQGFMVSRTIHYVRALTNKVQE